MKNFYRKNKFLAALQRHNRKHNSGSHLYFYIFLFGCDNSIPLAKVKL